MNLLQKLLLSVSLASASALSFAQCDVVVTHSSANFGGGQFIAQAGFVDGEAAAATFTVNASAWPLKFKLAEMIFVTSATTVTTTTQYEVMIWEGNPVNGNLVASYDSVSGDLPPLVIPPGTNGTNVQFQIDPNDPEQIILQNNGSNQFTVGYRILQHNSPSSNLCQISPATTANAFPSTDVGGLQQGANNWLFSIDCGFLGAPPGWKRFSELSTIFRPTGDWNIRATYEPAIAVAITDQPDDQILSAGQTAVFQVVAAGVGPFQYQWFKGTTPLTSGGRIIGATSDSLVILNVNASDLGTYRCVVTNACGSATSNNATLDFAGLPISGTVTLQNWTAPTTNIPVRLDFRNGGGTLLGSRTVALGANGSYSTTLPSTLSAGSYNIVAKASHWLGRLRVTNVVSPSGAAGVNFSLINGDINGDNEIGAADFSELAAAYDAVLGDSNYNPEADLNGDNEVGAADFSILAANYDEVGD